MPFVLLEIFPNQLLFVKAVDVAMMFQPSNKGPNKKVITPSWGKFMQHLENNNPP